VIIGCNTGFDISHGMGEVTNAYVTLQNTGSVDLPNTCGLLRAADEGRPHPDKAKCVDSLPAGYQVTLNSQLTQPSSKAPPSRWTPVRMTRCCCAWINSPAPTWISAAG